ncbi:MAG: hypothetical protein ISS71_03810 [Phycisphaerae bacterium]|nr:hypothetical protein [Phycisphaerae bacterium]
MDTDTAEKKPPTKSRLHKVLIIIIILLSIFTAVSLCLIFALAGPTPAQPRPMVLRHPDGQIVPAAATPENLEQAIQLTKEVGAQMLQNDPESVRQKLDELGNMMLSGQLVELPGDTACLLLQADGSRCKIQVTEGPQNGQTFWVPRQCVRRVRANIDGNIPVGFCCGAIYLRYLISAAICCVGIYFLKLKSVFLQITLFVIGMIIVNLIWIRFEMFLFL